MPDDDLIAVPLLSATEVAAPSPGYNDGYRSELDETDVIRQYAPLVKRLALYLKGRLPGPVQLDDLIQAGFIAVLRIARRTVSPLGADASLRRSVINAMIDEARREAWAPTRTMRLAKAAIAAMQAIRWRTGRDGSDEEVAAELGMPLRQYQQALVEVAGINLLNLDELDEDSGQELQVAGGQEEVIHQSRVTMELAEAVAALPEREKSVISLYYEHELNMEEIGEVLGLNKSTVCRAHGRALLMLRRALADRDLAADPLG